MIAASDVHEAGIEVGEIAVLEERVRTATKTSKAESSPLACQASSHCGSDSILLEHVDVLDAWFEPVSSLPVKPLAVAIPIGK